MSSTSIFSSILNIPTSKITNPDLGFSKIRFNPIKKQSFSIFHPVFDTSPSPSGPCSSTTIANSLTVDSTTNEEDVEEVKKAESILGSNVRVIVPLKVYHIPKVDEYELSGKVGVLKEYVGFHKGSRISANLPYKVEFVAEGVVGRGGKPAKFVAHLREDEFEILDSSESSD